MHAVDPERNCRWLLFASGSERESLREIEMSTDFQILWVGAEHILDAATVMGSCRMVIGGDNGLMHVAVASGVPTLTIFQPYPGVDPAAGTPPGYARHRYLIAPADETALSRFVESAESITNRLIDL